MIGMIGEVHGGCTAFSYLFPDGIVSDRCADHLFSGHVAKVTETRNT
jgi:hypothetical protein